MDKDELKEKLGEEAYNVTQHGATEQAFSGKYYKTKDDGVYKCIVCSEPLFSSDKKFDSHSGWPSFFHPENDHAVKLIEDDSTGMTRTEVNCKKCGSHLGHVFNDAPDTPTGQRYCINSCSLDFKKDKKDE